VTVRIPAPPPARLSHPGVDESVPDLDALAQPRTAMGEVIIRFAGVKKRFGEKIIFTDLNLELRRGETTTILGASGTGKSVLLKILIGLIPKDGGSIEFDGQDISNISDKKYADVRRRIAYLFQGAALFDSFSVGENVAYGLREQYWRTMSEDEIQARVAQSLGLVGLPGIQDMRPSDLSGGMRKRVGLARTLALHPQVILYDEPTTGLDPINTARINHLILGIQRALKITSVVVTHDMGTAFSVSNRIAMVGKGKIIAFAPKDEFRKTSDSYVLDFIEGRAPESEDVDSLLSSS
jgi:phospholipid/cholesterol/gamma-HCH transport system ATP-binding protein